MTAIISHNKGKETRWGRCQRYGSCSTARRWIQGSQTPLGNSVCQLCFIAFRSPFSIISRGITLTIYACTPCKHQWVRTKIIWASSPQLKILWKVFFSLSQTASPIPIPKPGTEAPSQAPFQAVFLNKDWWNHQSCHVLQKLRGFSNPLLFDGTVMGNKNQ